MARKKKQDSGRVDAVTSAPHSEGAAPATLKVSSSAKTAGKQQVSADAIRRSTAYFAVGIALVAGVYLGTLLPALLRGDAAPVQMQAPAQDPPEQAAVSQDITKHIIELEQLVAKNPQDLAAWINLGNLYFDTHNHKGAIGAYEKALAIKPDNADVLTDLGIMYRDEKMFDQAVSAFQKAAQVNPKHQNALFNRGVVLFYDLNRKDEGRTVWRQLLAINPNAKAPDGKSVRDMVEGR